MTVILFPVLDSRPEGSNSSVFHWIAVLRETAVNNELEVMAHAGHAPVSSGHVGRLCRVVPKCTSTNEHKARMVETTSGVMNEAATRDRIKDHLSDLSLSILLLL